MIKEIVLKGLYILIGFFSGIYFTSDFQNKGNLI